MSSTGDQRTTHNDEVVLKRAINRWENEGGKPATSTASAKPMKNAMDDNPNVECDGVIKMHLRKSEELFDSLDHSAFRERDLDPRAEDYIVESVRELPSQGSCMIVIYLDDVVDVSAESKAISEAVHHHFSRRVQILRRNLRQLLRRGLISLVIGVGVLGTFLLLGHVIRGLIGDAEWAVLLHESMLIGGWVAMWKPLEILLYDWWPIIGEQRFYARLSQIQVQVRQKNRV